MLTGEYSFEHGVRSHTGYRLNSGIRTIPEDLRAAGYTTAPCVTGPLLPDVGLGRGFDEYRYRDRTRTVFTDFGGEFLTSFRSRPQPWFTLLHIWTLHQPRQVLPEFRRARFGATEYARAVSSLDPYIGRLLAAAGDETIVVLAGDHGEKIVDGRVNLFWKRSRSWLFRALKRRGFFKGTPTSRAIRDTHAAGHGFIMTDEVIRIPFLIRHPGLVRHGTSDVQVSQIDILPTVLDIAGVPRAKRRGTSCVSIMKGLEGNDRDVFLEVTGLAIANEDEWSAGLRTAKHKFIYYPHRPEFGCELYDLEADPDERRNLAGEHVELVDEFVARLEDFKIREHKGEELDEAVTAVMRKRLADLGCLD